MTSKMEQQLMRTLQGEVWVSAMPSQHHNERNQPVLSRFEDLAWLDAPCCQASLVNASQGVGQLADVAPQRLFCHLHRDDLQSASPAVRLRRLGHHVLRMQRRRDGMIIVDKYDR